MQDDVYFRVNYDRFNIHTRNQVIFAPALPPGITERLFKLIEAAVRERFNNCAALVMRSLLKVTEARQLRIEDVRSG